MRIIIDVTNNGIHRSATIDVEGWTSEDIKLVSEITDAVEKYNKEQVENA